MLSETIAIEWRHGMLDGQQKLADHAANVGDILCIRNHCAHFCKEELKTECHENDCEANPLGKAQVIIQEECLSFSLGSLAQ